jgi:hypothetical protein
LLNYYDKLAAEKVDTDSHSKIERGGGEKPTFPAGGQAQVRVKRIEGRLHELG